MIFSTLIFLFRFLPIALLVYYLAPAKMKNIVLFVVSLVFYSWGEIKYFPIMGILILINYCSGLAMERWDANKKVRRAVLIFSVIGSLSMLVYFKYLSFIVESLATIFGIYLPQTAEIQVLPLGISFYTFQTMSYSIDVYRREVKAEHNIIDFGAYVVMFPQLIAGPIVKYRDISNKLHEYDNRISLEQVEKGVSIFIFGLAKKVLLADGIARLWTDIIGVYSGEIQITAGVGLENASTALVWLGVVAYSFQLYFDFSGYSMMAIGMGKMLGFDFPDNFNLPYISRSITEFWRRWHITLSSWFREYVYIPLGGNRKGLYRQILNMFVVWALTGIWHGANWNFLAWGLYYFILLTLEKIVLLPILEKGKIWPHIYTLVLVAIGWALFVGNEPGVGLGLLIQKMFVLQGGVGVLYFLRNYAVILAISVLCCTPLPTKLWKQITKKKWQELFVLIALFMVCIAYISGSSNSPFLYFNF